MSTPVMAIERDGYIACGAKGCARTIGRLVDFIGKHFLLEIRCRKCKSLNRYERPNPITGS